MSISKLFCGTSVQIQKVISTFLKQNSLTNLMKLPVIESAQLPVGVCNEIIKNRNLRIIKVSFKPSIKMFTGYVVRNI